MKKRNIVIVVLLSLITLGIYSIYWEVVTKKEMVSQGADIPTAWLIIIPFVNIYWLYKYCMGVEKVSSGKMSGILLFVLFILFGIIGQAVAQDTLNKVADGSAMGASVPASPAVASPSLQPEQASPVADVQSPAPAEPVASAPVEQSAPEDQTPGSQPPTTPTPIVG